MTLFLSFLSLPNAGVGNLWSTRGYGTATFLISCHWLWGLRLTGVEVHLWLELPPLKVTEKIDIILWCLLVYCFCYLAVRKTFCPYIQKELPPCSAYILQIFPMFWHLWEFPHLRPGKPWKKLTMNIASWINHFELCPKISFDIAGGILKKQCGK